MPILPFRRDRYQPRIHGWCSTRQHGGLTVDIDGMNQDSNHHSPLHSSYEDDPDLRDLVVLFVDELDGRVGSIRSAFDASDLAELQNISHQLKGAAGGYGFDPIGDAAGRLEYDLLGDEADMSRLSERVEDLITLCRAAVRPRD